MFPNLAARETCVAETNFAARKTKTVFAWSQKHFCFPDTNLASETFPSLASPGNITRNIVSATMFPGLARPLEKVTYIRHRLDGSLFDLRRFHAKTKCEFVIEALSADDCSLMPHSELDLQLMVDSFSEASTVKPRFNEPRYNEDPVITNNI